jgi:hypothetical protein
VLCCVSGRDACDYPNEIKVIEFAGVGGGGGGMKRPRCMVILSQLSSSPSL